MLLPVIGTAQKKEISLEDIYKKGSLRVAPVWAGFNEGNDETPLLPFDLNPTKE